MIASLFGIVEYRDDPYLVLEVNGVGYKVHASVDVLATATPKAHLKLFIYTHVKEDALDLYGFANQNDLKIFELLISVSGIGPKTAIGVFSIGHAGEIVSAIQSGNVEYFTSVPRLGRKNAQKLIIELKNKLGSTIDLDLSESFESSDIITALKSFGFSQTEAQDAIKHIDTTAKTEQEKVKLALKYLGK